VGTQRIFRKNGNNVVISLSSETLKRIQLNVGDEVMGKIVNKDEEFINTLNDVIKEHDNAFKGLIKR
jgi:antitoxin MazE